MNIKEMIVWLTGLILTAVVIAGGVYLATKNKSTEVVLEDRKNQREAEKEKTRPLKLWERERKGNDQ